jgi:hypothetical protein
MRSSPSTGNQGDQIGRFFAHWDSVCFGQVFLIAQADTDLKTFFPL